MTTVAKGAAIVLVMVVAAITAPRVVPPQGGTHATDGTSTIQAQMGSSSLTVVLVRSCGDCHSWTTATAWYTRVPPFSALLARGAREGRTAVNFAEWSRYTPEQQRALLLASCSDVRRGTMPMSAYLRLRPEARLSAGDIETICAAARPIESASTMK